MAFGNFAGGFAKTFDGAGTILGAKKLQILQQQQQMEKNKQIMATLNANMNEAAKNIKTIVDGTNQKSMAIQNDATLAADKRAAMITNITAQRDQAISHIVGPIEQTLTLAQKNGLPVQPGSFQSLADNLATFTPTTQENAQNQATTKGNISYAEEAGKNKADQEIPAPKSTSLVTLTMPGGQDKTFRLDDPQVDAALHAGAKAKVSPSVEQNILLPLLTKVKNGGLDSLTPNEKATLNTYQRIGAVDQLINGIVGGLNLGPTSPTSTTGEDPRYSQARAAIAAGKDAAAVKDQLKSMGLDPGKL